MAKVFKGNNGVYYSSKDLEINKILKNSELLLNHTMAELDSFYKQYYGDCSYGYRNILETKIKLYDKSKFVNGFIFNGNNEWFDKATRISLMQLANCGEDYVTLILSNDTIEIPVNLLKEFLTQLEIYANKCFIQTQKHLASIKDLQIPEDFINYDFTTGYPEKLVLKL